ncbi:MAG: hypothetical protein JSS46_01730, partial [Proteobacteria bacterium]|nr:hypothetical protein [Pseudomonadota bacterium]
NEQALLARLSVFAGGFGLEAAETICGAEPLDPVDVLDLITSLVEKSLLRVEENDDGVRYRMLETIREYANEKLVLRDEQTATRTAHCDYFLTFAKASRRGMEGSEQAEWIRRIEQVHDDLRSAIALTLSGGVDPVLAVKFVVAMMGFWILRGYSTEGRNYVRTALALPAVQASDNAHAYALYIGATLADAQSNYAEAAHMLEQCVALRRALDSRVDLAAALSTASMVRLHIGEAAIARGLESEAVAIFREIGNPIGESIGLLHLGQIDAYVGNDADARSNFEKSLKIASELEYFEVESECALMLGQLAMRGGDEADARGHFSRGLEVSRKAEDKRNEASALWWLGAVDLRHGELAAAQVRLSAALRAFVASEMFSELLGCLEDHAVLLGALDRPDDAVRVCAAVEAARERLVLPRPPREALRWEDRLARLRAAVEPDRFERIWRDGSNLELRDAVAFVEAQRVAEAATV